MNYLSSLYLFFFLFFNTTCSNAQVINWLTIEEVESAIKKEPRKVLIDVYTDWCRWCKKMDISTFADPQIIEYVNKNYYCVKLNGEDRNTLTFKGVEFNFISQGKRGYHELAAGFLKGKMSYPSLVFLDEDLVVLQVMNGFRTADELYPILAFLGENIYKNSNWEDYINQTKGEK